MTKALTMSMEQDLKAARRSANAVKQARIEEQAKRERIQAIRVCYPHAKDVPFALLLTALKKVGVEGLQEICKSNLNAFLVKKAIHRVLGIVEVKTGEATETE